MGTKFFTNLHENTLLEKFNGVFQYSEIHFFDVLVGFFYASGFYRIYNQLSQVQKVRILVGIELDKATLDATLKGLELRLEENKFLEKYERKLKEDIQSSEYRKEVEEGMVTLMKWVAQGKIEIRIHKSRKIHAKIYIFRKENEHEHLGWGSVISGSSNLTAGGLENNFEFNVELRDYDDVRFSLNTFEKLWLEGINVHPGFLQSILNKTYLSDEFSPFEIYIKFLSIHFGSSVDYDPESSGSLPPGYIRLAYQVDAVNEGFSKLMIHNGFILADVVGLGKTLVATIIARKFYFSNGIHTRILIVSPPALIKNWERTIREFEVNNVKFITNGSLHKIKHPEDFDLIIVDEAHKFRSDKSERFNQLQKICKTSRKRPGVNGSLRKKVILVTATPLNNTPEDIRNQLLLFQDARDSTLEINLQAFFRKRIDEFKALKKETNRDVLRKEIKRINELIRTKVLTPLIVRRTRTDIRNTPAYIEDLQKQGMRFPEIEPPRKILYQLPDQLNRLYDKTLNLIKDTKSGLRYFRYQAIAHLKEKYQPKNASRISSQLANIMRILLVKRIDSSFEAFKKSLGRYLRRNKAMIKMFENDRVYIAPSLNVSEYIMENNEAELEKILAEAESEEIGKVYRADDFSKEFREGLESDNSILKDLVEEWDKVEVDPKFEQFLCYLNNEFKDPQTNKSGKLVVFSESKETTNYLKKKLEEKGVKKILAVDSSNQSKLSDTIELNFDARLQSTLQQNDFDIIITTEVLAEGVNLHRANVIVNYDIPWNATRLMQRIGRVNRIGTEADSIIIYNFFPTAQTDDEIELNKKAFIKLQAFHSALGEDSQIYSQEEEYETFGLFEQVPEEERDERLIYLQKLREFKDREPERYRKIIAMPLRARAGRRNQIQKGGSIIYLKNHIKDSFIFVSRERATEELTFLEAARIFEAHPTEKSIGIHDLHHSQVNIATQLFWNQYFSQTLSRSTSRRISPNEQYALSFIKDSYFKQKGTQEELELFKAAREAIRKGIFQNLPREINKIRIAHKKKTSARVMEDLLIVFRKYPLLDPEEKINGFEEQEIIDSSISARKPEIIISESFN